MNKGNWSSSFEKSTARKISFGWLPSFAILGLLSQAASPGYAQSNVRFHDIANSEAAGLSYSRTPSVHAARWEQILAGGVLALPELINTPHKWRGSPGVAILDYDNDGDQDLYVTNGPGSNNSLFSNQLAETGVLTFIDLAAAAGVGAPDQDSSGVCYGDTDNDGDEDLFVLSTFGTNRFFENNGSGSFTDMSASSGLGEESMTSMSCSFGDVNSDGLLDVVVANSYLDFNSLLGIAGEPFALNLPNHLFLNTGGNTFADASEVSGIRDLHGFPPTFDAHATLTWAIAMVDYDADGDVDIVHADDQAGIPRAEHGGVNRGFIRVLRNDGSGRFADVTMEINMGHVGDWMGLSFGDVNSDGIIDIFGSNLGDWTSTTSTPLDPVYGNFQVYQLGNNTSRWFLGSREGVFSDPGVGGLVATPFGWGTTMADYDNDADVDIIYHGGMALGPAVNADNMGVVLSNDGSGAFVWDSAALAESTDHQRRNVHGVASGDLDDDGFVDVVSVSNFDIQDSIPIVPFNVEWGAPFDGLVGYQATFVPTEVLGLWVHSGSEDNVNGSVSVEINNADSGNGWVKVKLVGAAGLLPAGVVNRDGIGAVVRVRTMAGASATRPVLGGSSFASQDGLELAFGLGSAEKSWVDVLWPGGGRNRLYDVQDGERILFPEIPCSFADEWDHAGEYLRCVRGALDGLEDAGVLDHNLKRRFFASALRAFAAKRRGE